jgi:hypothetical protein
VIHTNHNTVTASNMEQLTAMTNVAWHQEVNLPDVRRQLISSKSDPLSNMIIDPNIPQNLAN